MIVLIYFDLDLSNSPVGGDRRLMVWRHAAPARGDQHQGLGARSRHRLTSWLFAELRRRSCRSRSGGPVCAHREQVHHLDIWRCRAGSRSRSRSTSLPPQQDRVPRISEPDDRASAWTRTACGHSGWRDHTVRKLHQFITWIIRAGHLIPHGASIT
jgi:hypothetical protein